MALVHDRSICLRKIEYSETSQILHLFTREHGVIHVIAKGAHRRTKVGASKFDGGIDLIDLGDAVFTLHLREMETLTEWHLLDGHLELRQDLRSLNLAVYCAELVGTVVEANDPHTLLFDRLEQTLKEVSTARREEAFLMFQLDLLQETGVMPEFFACVVTGALLTSHSGPVKFSPSRGGVVCGDALKGITDGIPLDPRLLRLVQTILRLPRQSGAAQRLPKLTRHQTDPLNRLLAAHIQFSLGKRLRMLNWVLA